MANPPTRSVANTCPDPRWLARCNTLACPQNFVAKNDNGNIACNGEQCSLAKDRETCCEPTASCATLGSCISPCKRAVGLDGFYAWMRGPLAARLRRALKPTSPHVARRGLRVGIFGLRSRPSKGEGSSTTLCKARIATEMWISIRAALVVLHAAIFVAQQRGMCRT